MTAIPADVLAPETTTPLATRTSSALQSEAIRSQKLPVPSQGRRILTRRYATRCRGRRRRGRERRVEVLRDVGNAPLEGHRPALRVLRDEVGLGADDVQHDALAQLLAQVRQPAAHLAEAVVVGDAVAQDAGVRAAVVQARDGAEALLPGRVPDLQPHDGVGVGVEDALGQERGADRRRRVGLWSEGAVDVAVDEGGLADALRAEHDNFGFEGGHGGG